MKYMIVHWGLSALAMWLTAQIVSGFVIASPFTAIIGALVIGLVNATLGMAVKIITFPLTLMTLGLFWLIINALMIEFSSALGSIRIPAALCGVVGFKSTARLVPVDGVLPLSTTLDTVCALTRSVPDAVLVHEILAQRHVVRSPAPLSAYRLGVANAVMLDGLDKTVTQAWHRTLGMLRRAGARIEDIALSEINELQQIQASGGFSAAESYALHHQLLASKKESYDSRVVARIERGASMSARDYIELLMARSKWIGRMTQRLQRFDAVLSPTVAVVAPPISDIAPGAQRDDAFFRTNALLLRNTSVVNMLDGCAISIPCHAAGELPVGLMVWAGALQDDPVLNIALEIENLLRQP